MKRLENGEQTKGKLFEFTDDVGLKPVPKICSYTGEKTAFIYAKAKEEINWEPYQSNTPRVISLILNLLRSIQPFN